MTNKRARKIVLEAAGRLADGSAYWMNEALYASGANCSLVDPYATWLFNGDRYDYVPMTDEQETTARILALLTYAEVVLADGKT